jgi:hypothetical protein
MYAMPTEHILFNGRYDSPNEVPDWYEISDGF